MLLGHGEALLPLYDLYGSVGVPGSYLTNFFDVREGNCTSSGTGDTGGYFYTGGAEALFI